MLSASLSLFFVVAGAIESGGAAEKISLRDDKLFIGDIAFVDAGRELVVARLPQHVASISLAEAERENLIRRRLPGVEFQLRHKGLVTVERGDSKASAMRLAGPCYAARIDLSARQYVTLDDVEEAECGAGPGDRRLRYDAAAGSPIARETIPAGTYLGRLRLDSRKPVHASQNLVAQMRVGPIIVERNVKALYAGRPGSRMFVRTDDNEILAATFAAQPTEPVE